MMLWSLLFHFLNQSKSVVVLEEEVLVMVDRKIKKPKLPIKMVC